MSRPNGGDLFSSDACPQRPRLIVNCPHLQAFHVKGDLDFIGNHHTALIQRVVPADVKFPAVDGGRRFEAESNEFRNPVGVLLLLEYILTRYVHSGRKTIIDFQSVFHPNQPKGLADDSPGLLVRATPGTRTRMNHNPEGVAENRSPGISALALYLNEFQNPVGVRCIDSFSFPGLDRSQPQAFGRNPVGVRLIDSFSFFTWVHSLAWKSPLETKPARRATR